VSEPSYQEPDQPGAQPPADAPDSVESLEMALNPLVFRIADSTVLIGVKPTERGPELLYADAGDTMCAVAYTDPKEIRRDLPEGYRLFQIAVPDLLRRLHPACGLLIDPRAASPLLVMPYEREAVLAAGLPFPPGAPVRVRKHGAPQPALVAAALARLDPAAGLLRVHLTRYQVADAREKVLVVYEHDSRVEGSDGAAADAFMAAAADVGLSDPMQIVALADVPDIFRRMILDDVPPVWVRPGLKA
jgi:heme-degrading monooxygenase HmoA